MVFNAQEFCLGAGTKSLSPAPTLAKQAPLWAAPTLAKQAPPISVTATARIQCQQMS